MLFHRDRTTVRRLHTFDDFDEFSAQVELLWAQLLRGRPHQPQYNPSLARPPVDVYLTADTVVVVVEAPGMRDQEVRLELDGNRLTIRGQKRSRLCPEGHAYHQMEIACGPFSRTIELPAEVDPEHVALHYEDGYIEIRLPRVQRQLERHVRITLHQS